MATYDVLRALVRRWYVLAPCLALTLVGAWLIHERPGVYMVDTTVYFVAPADARTSGLADTSAGLISLAGGVERTVNAGSDAPEPVSPEVSIADTGVRSGYRVSLPNAGGQFVVDFDRPALQVQAVGEEPGEAARLFRQAEDLVLTTLDQIQAADGINQDGRVTARLVPDKPDPVYLGGSPARALVVAGVLGAALSVAVTLIVDHLLTRRSRRRSAGAIATSV